MTNFERLEELRFAATMMLESLKTWRDFSKKIDYVVDYLIEDLEQTIRIFRRRSENPDGITDKYISRKKDILMDIFDEMWEDIPHYKNLGEDRRIAFLASCGMEDI